MSEPPRWLLVVNPSAGRGRGARLAPRLPDLLARAGVSARIALSERPGHAGELARAAAEAGTRHFAAAGGDGTAHEVVNGLAAYARGRGDTDRLESLAAFSLSIVPIGTGNDWARSLGLARSLEASIARLARGRALACDLGRVHCSGRGQDASRLFVNVAGAGFDGFVLERLGHRKPGAWAYLAELLRSHRHFQPPMLAAGDPPRPTLAVFACLGSHCGGGMKMAPGARVDDGLLDVTRIDAMTGGQLLWELRRLFDGSIGRSRHVRTFVARALEIGSEPACAVQADGELLGLTPARVEVLPGAIGV
ncbi:MAG TPA: diacylglycerol kinase family protein, partial [Burkholderiaceae bacterium]